MNARSVSESKEDKASFSFLTQDIAADVAIVEGNITRINTAHPLKASPVILDTTDCFTCSFKEFLPFCSKLYYYSSFKEFQGVAWIFLYY